jgi:ATP-binding cassette subfamily B protein
MFFPDSFKKAVGKKGIDPADIIFAASADMSGDYRFAQSIAAITKDKLIFAAYPVQEKEEYSLGGYPAWVFSENKRSKDTEEEPKITVYNLEDIKKTEVAREIGSGILLIETEDSEKMVCRFSNTKMEAFMRLCRIIEKQKKGDEIKPEDLDVKRGKECCPKCGLIYPDQERKVCPKCMDRKSILLRMLSYFKYYKAGIAVMFLCFIGTAGLNLVWPYLSGTVVYDKILGQDENFLEKMGLPGGKFVLALGILTIAMIITKALIQLLGVIQGVITAHIAPDVVSRLKTQVFDSMGRLSISFFSKRQTGGLMTRVSGDAEQISGFFIDGLPYFLINIATMTVTAVIMFTLNVPLAIVSIMFLPVLFFVSYRMLPHLWHFYGKRHRSRRRLNAQMNENFAGARVVKAFGQEGQELKRFDKSSRRLKEAEIDLVRYDNRFYTLYTATEEIISFIVWAVGGALVLSRSGLEYGLLITFAGYVGQMKGPMDFMSFFVRWYTDSMNSAQRMFEIIDAVPEVREAKEPIRKDRIKGELELKNVTFGYEPNKPVLKDVSFKVRAGETLGIVGKSGAGKSTLVNLISRLYDPDEGEVFVDGINVREYAFETIRRNVAMVSQETYIFMGTVAENIAYAKPDATREEIINAAVRASAHDFICKMPEGYDTLLGAAGRKLSGGEKQRISIARAILADPQILILDEATSAVDTETELAIQKSIEALSRGRTVLSIAHRLSTLRNAAHLIVVEDGKVAEEGTHKELIEKKGVFYKLMQLQTKALAMRGME